MIFDDKYLIDKLHDNKIDVSIENLSNYINGEDDNNKNLIASMNELRMKISEQLRLDKICFLVGNGCSIYAGSQNTNSFELIENTRNRYTNINRLLDNIKNLDMEKQLNRLLVIKEYYRLTNDKNKERYIDSIYKKAKDNLIKNYVNSIDYNLLTCHENLLLKLRNCNCLNKLQIYSLNYDLAFEYVMDKMQIEYSDGFTGFVNRIFDPQHFLEDKAKIIKLHGSLNWYEDDIYIKSNQPKFSKDLDAIKIKVEDTEPLLIYPTSNKFYQTFNTPYSELMRYMLDSLKTGSNILFVIGYKYGDEHINEIIKKTFINPNNFYYFFDFDNCLSNNSIKDNANDNLKFLSYVRDLSNKISNIDIIQGRNLASFQFFVNYIFPDIPKIADEEKLIKILNDMRDKYDK